MPYNLLIVDDKDLTRRNLTIFFEQSGHTVAQANTGEAALELMGQAGFDIVISDLRLPGSVNGLDVLKHHAEIRPGAGLILMTAFGSEEVRSETERLGALYYEKPISLNELLASVETFPPAV
jgi:DNA-binding NtrC family response regulator